MYIIFEENEFQTNPKRVSNEPKEYEAVTKQLCTCMRTYLRTQSHVYIYIYTCTHPRTHPHTHKHTHGHTHSHIPTLIQVYTCGYACVHSRVGVHARMRMQLCVHLPLQSFTPPRRHSKKCKVCTLS